MSTDRLRARLVKAGYDEDDVFETDRSELLSTSDEYLLSPPIPESPEKATLRGVSVEELELKRQKLKLKRQKKERLQREEERKKNRKLSSRKRDRTRKKREGNKNLSSRKTKRRRKKREENRKKCGEKKI